MSMYINVCDFCRNVVSQKNWLYRKKQGGIVQKCIQWSILRKTLQTKSVNTEKAEVVCIKINLYCL